MLLPLLLLATLGLVWAVYRFQVAQSALRRWLFACGLMAVAYGWAWLIFGAQ